MLQVIPLLRPNLWRIWQYTYNLVQVLDDTSGRRGRSIMLSWGQGSLTFFQIAEVLIACLPLAALREGHVTRLPKEWS